MHLPIRGEKIEHRFWRCFFLLCGYTLRQTLALERARGALATQFAFVDSPEDKPLALGRTHEPCVPTGRVVYFMERVRQMLASMKRRRV